MVREGPLVSRGMPAFSELSDRTLAAMTHYLRQRAREVRAAGLPDQPVDDRGQ